MEVSSKDVVAEAVTEPPLVIACSPRPGGNSDTMAQTFAQGIRDAGGTSRIVFLREKTIAPCTGCSVCNPSGKCVLAPQDDAQKLFAAMLAAPFVMFSAPVYFYHLPAMFKAFIDRAQCYYLASRQKGLLSSHKPAFPKRRAYVALCAGRPRGEKLFDGSLLTLTYFLAEFRFALHEPALFRGMDGPKDFRTNAQAMNHIHALGQAAWMDACQRTQG